MISLEETNIRYPYEILLALILYFMKFFFQFSSVIFIYYVVGCQQTSRTLYRLLTKENICLYSRTNIAFGKRVMTSV